MKPPLLYLDAQELVRAKRCAALIASAYDMYVQWQGQKRPHRDAGFTWTTPAEDGLTFSTPLWSAQHRWWFSDVEPFGFACRDTQADAWLVFRGTDTISDWLVDGDADQAPFGQDGGLDKAHHGFVGLYASMRDEILHVINWLGPIRHLTVTGHSLGCGLSTLAVADLAGARASASIEHISFASPRVGSVGFARRYANLAVPTLRFVNSCDLVPQVPLPVAGKWLYEHVGTPVEFSANYGSVVDNHNLERSYRYALDHPDAPCAVVSGAD